MVANATGHSDKGFVIIIFFEIVMGLGLDEPQSRNDCETAAWYPKNDNDPLDPPTSLIAMWSRPWMLTKMASGTRSRTVARCLVALMLGLGFIMALASYRVAPFLIAM